MTQGVYITLQADLADLQHAVSVEQITGYAVELM